MESCEASGHKASDHFRGATEMVGQLENSVVKDFFITAADVKGIAPSKTFATQCVEN